MWRRDDAARQAAPGRDSSQVCSQWKSSTQPFTCLPCTLRCVSGVHIARPSSCNSPGDAQRILGASTQQVAVFEEASAQPWADLACGGRPACGLHPATVDLLPSFLPSLLRSTLLFVYCLAVFAFWFAPWYLGVISRAITSLCHQQPSPNCLPSLLLLLFSHPVVSNSSQSHGLLHARLLCSSLSPGVCSDSCPSSQWCSYHFILSHTHILLPSIFPSIRVFSNELALCIRWPKYWGFSFSISPSNEYSVLISFRIDWFGLLVVQGTLKSTPQHHNSKASILLHQPFYGPTYMTIESHSLDYTDVCWQWYLLFNMLSWFVIGFFPRGSIF